MSVKKQQGSQTRDDILEAAFGEIYAQGFRAASLDNILKKTKVSKGALYHHFPNKKALGYAVLEEVIKPQSEEKWKRLQNPANNPLDILLVIIQEMVDEMTTETVQLGCPICNLVNEMSGIDEGFQERLAIFRNEWRNALSIAIQRGQEQNMVLKTANPEAVASFLIACHDGAHSVGKATQDLAMFEHCAQEMGRYIQGLRVKH